MGCEMCIKGVEAICKAVGEQKNDFKRLVRDEGLPAWRRSESDAWRALPEDLKEWLVKQREKYGKAS